MGQKETSLKIVLHGDCRAPLRHLCGTSSKKILSEVLAVDSGGLISHLLIFWDEITIACGGFKLNFGCANVSCLILCSCEGSFAIFFLSMFLVHEKRTQKYDSQP